MDAFENIRALLLACAIAIPGFSSGVSAAELDQRTPVFIQYYDWDSAKGGYEFLAQFDWEQLGLTGLPEERNTQTFYSKQFAYIKALGIDGISWEYHPRLGKGPLLPSEAALAALRENDLKIAAFYDLEISLKIKNWQGEELLPNLSNQGKIVANQEFVDHMVGDLAAFFARVPKDLVARDEKGRIPIFVFGYGFNDSAPDPQQV